MIIFLEYPKCGTCQKAKKWLDEQNVIYTSRNIKTENPTQPELIAWQLKSGLPLKRFFNTSGMLYRELNLKDKLATMSDTEQIRLIASDGMLVKRPILVTDDTVLVGFREKDWEKACK